MKIAKAIAAATVMAAAMFAAGATAKTPAGLDSLIGMRGSSLEHEMAGKGYTFVKAQGPQYWWSTPDNTCAVVSISQGRVSRIDTGTPAQCGRRPGAAASTANAGRANAIRVCTENFGPGGKLGAVSALQAGFWEVMMTDANGRKVACTGTAKGSVEEWNELGRH